MKRIILLLLVIVTAAIFAACGNSAAPVESDYPDFLIDEGTPETEEPDEVIISEYGELVTGTVVYYDGAMLMICSLDNTNLNFLVAGGEVDKSEARELAVGSEVDIYFKGTVNGNDTSAAQVTKLVQSRKQAAVRTDLSVIGGVILGSDGSTLRITAFSGGELTFSIANEIDMENTNGLTAGDYVTVFYEGEITGDNAETVNVIKLVQ